MLQPRRARTPKTRAGWLGSDRYVKTKAETSQTIKRRARCNHAVAGSFRALNGTAAYLRESTDDFARPLQSGTECTV